MLGITPSQTVGPYFAYGLTPRDYGRAEIVTSNLLTPATLGQRIRIEGRVLDGDGAGIGDAMIEIWQADAGGFYAHPADQRRRSNVGFKGFGRCSTDGEGRYAFQTNKPGQVPGPGGTMQAPHITVGVFARGVLRRLATRLYFSDESANADDPILACVPTAERRATLIARRRDGAGDPAYVFDIRLQGEGETVFFAG
jgi:protocatechuate 3,4-dioxygenase, alpha subunit